MTDTETEKQEGLIDCNKCKYSSDCELFYEVKLASHYRPDKYCGFICKLGVK